MMKQVLKILLVSIVTTQFVFAGNNDHSPRMPRDIYQFGGGQIPLPATGVISARNLAIGIGFDAGLACGKFDPKITISNQLNGITEGFKQMMGNIIQSATSAVASLPGLALQKAAPELYELLQQGVLQGKMDFEWAKTSCEEMQRVITGEESFPFENFKFSASYEDMAYSVGDTGGDAVEAIAQVDAIVPGNAGTDWVCGIKKGGLTQLPINLLSDIVVVGYNVMFDRTNLCGTGTVSAGLAVDSPLYDYWNGPLIASDWAIKVLGNEEIRTCEGCKKIRGKPGKGLVFQHRETMKVIRDDLINLVDERVVLSWQNLRRVSALPGVVMQDTTIRAIRKRDAFNRLPLINKIASEIAYVRIIEQSKLLTQLLMTGIKEPNAANNEVAVRSIHRAIDKLKIELDLLDREITVRKDVASGTMQKLMLLEEKSVQEASKIGRGSRNSRSILGTLEQ